MIKDHFCLLLPISLLLVQSHTVCSQDRTHNHVCTVTYLENGRDSIVSVQYYDGFGRPNQKVEGGINASGIYLHSYTEYDGAGREQRTWLPVKGSTTPGYLQPSVISLSSLIQYHDDLAYTEATYDALDRTTFTSTPGVDWLGRGKQCIYRSNDTLEVRRYSTADLSGTSYYLPRSLNCTENWDEDSLRIQVFTDIQDRTILERRGIGEDLSDTYYVYNDRSQLVYVLTPQYQEDPNLSHYAYCYQYDSRGRISSRKLPGCEPITYEYDNAGRVVRMQDGLLRAASKHRVYTYDNLGRLLCQAIEGGAPEFINYYDGYSFLSQYDSLNLERADGRLFGLQWYTDNESYASGSLTGTWQLASDGTGLLMTYVYDDHGRVVKRSESGNGGTVLVSEYAYNFVGDITSEITTHYINDPETAMLVSDYSLIQETRYDNHGTRLPSSTLTCLYDNVNDNSVSSVENLYTYDDYGQLLANDRSGVSGDLFYSYDTIHGWLNGISCPSSGFIQRLYRERVEGIRRWNGSLSAMTWQTEQGVEQRYDYMYDTQNRLMAADYSQQRRQTIISAPLSLLPTRLTIPDYSATYEYDRNSNVTSLVRHGRQNDNTYGVIDALDFTYAGNQLRDINDRVSTLLSYTGCSEFVDGSQSPDTIEYSYNGNGALTKDLNRNITDIEYDLLGNPTLVTFSGGRTTSYVYSADGRKLRTTHRQGIRTPETIHYDGPFEFRNGYIDRISFSGGYCDYDYADEEWYCHYYITDYQGSVRMVVKQDALAGAVPEQVTHYYPYGGVIGDISTNETLQRNKFEGKELDRTFGLDNYDIEARQYFAMAPMWDRVDPLAEKYYGISPYAYCAGNPVNCVDTNGKAVRIKGDMALSIIKNTLPADASQFILINSEGYIDESLMSQYKGDSENFRSLYSLVSSPLDVLVTTLEHTSFVSNDGVIRQENFEPVIVETDPEFVDTNVEGMTSLTTGETGNLGVTYMPLSVNPQKMEKADASNPDIIHININPTLSKVGAAEIFSHEGYAHAVLYVSNPSNRWAAMHQGTGWGPDPNTVLFEKTIRARKETLNNMKK